MTHATTAPVSHRALLQRINRLFKKSNQYLTLKTTRPRSFAHKELGDFFIVNDERRITASHVNIEALGRELGVLREWEHAAEE